MKSKKPTVLIVDDDKAICDLVCDGLTEQGYACNTALNADDAFGKFEKYIFDVVLLDIKLPDISGMDMLKMLEKHYQMPVIIMITAVNDLETAVKAMKLGASDYIVKPFTFDKINSCISRVLKNRKPLHLVNNTIPDMWKVDYDTNIDDSSLSEINAIAYGVDARVDHFDSHSKIVTEKTVKLAQWLGLPEKEIEGWAVARNELYSERDRRIESALRKLERNPIAQVTLGLTCSVCDCPEHGERKN